MSDATGMLLKFLAQRSSPFVNAAAWTRIRCSFGFGVGTGLVVRVRLVDILSGWKIALIVRETAVLAIVEADNEKFGTRFACNSVFLGDTVTNLIHVHQEEKDFA